MKKIAGFLGGRKFTTAVGYTFLIVLNSALNLGITEDALVLGAGVLGAWILGESAADTGGAIAEGLKKKK